MDTAYTARGARFIEMCCSLTSPSPGTAGSRCDFSALSVPDPRAHPWGSLCTSLHPYTLTPLHLYIPTPRHPDSPVSIPTARCPSRGPRSPTCAAAARRSAAFSTRTAPLIPPSPRVTARPAPPRPAPREHSPAKPAPTTATGKGKHGEE